MQHEPTFSEKLGNMANTVGTAIAEAADSTARAVGLA
jgi:hypothetical protein